MSSNVTNIVKRRPPKPPTVWKPVKFKHFLQFVTDLDILVEYYDELLETKRAIYMGGDIPESLESLGSLSHDEYTEIIESCRESMRRYDRDGDNDPRYDEDGDLTFEYASKRLGAMMDNWLNTKFEDEDAAARFGQSMVEHVLAHNPTAAELESACRKLVDRSKPFTPNTGEVVRAVKAEKEAWEPRKSTLRNVERLYKEVVEAIPKAKAAAEKRKAEAEAKAARYRAETEASCARRRIEAEAEAACKQAEAEEARWKSQEVGEAMLHGIGQQSAREHVALQDSLKKIKNAFTTGELIAMVSCAIGLFEERRKLRAWERETEAELEAEMRVQDFYNYGGTAALKSLRSLEDGLKAGAAWTAVFDDACRVSFALGLFEMRRELCAWRQGWARNRFGLPIWA
jgi:hypothetical protein